MGEPLQIGRAMLYMGCCLDILPRVPSVDAVIADIPYGTTQCAWDAVIPLPSMWAALEHLMRPGVPVVLFGCEPFSSALRMSNIKRFKYDWVWHKPKGTGFLNAKKRPMRCHEMVSVFSNGKPPYYPQMTEGHERRVSLRKAHLQTEIYGQMNNDYRYDSTSRYPRSVITFSSDTQNSSLHRTQKPVDLMAYLIATYTNPGATVIDFTMGSGTTGEAALATGRAFIGIEKDERIFEIARNRLEPTNG